MIDLHLEQIWQISMTQSLSCHRKQPQHKHIDSTPKTGHTIQNLLQTGHLYHGAGW